MSVLTAGCSGCAWRQHARPALHPATPAAADPQDLAPPPLQTVVDAPNSKKSDLRRARSALCNLAPTSTGSATAIALIFPGGHARGAPGGRGTAL